MGREPGTLVLFQPAPRHAHWPPTALLFLLLRSRFRVVVSHQIRSPFLFRQQVTKAFRAGGALLMAPVVDTLIGRVQLWLDARKGVRGGSSGSSGDALLGGGGTGDGGGKGTSREQAFTVVVFACVAFALLLFGGVVVLWAY